jgi:hypothetical protein
MKVTWHERCFAGHLIRSARNDGRHTQDFTGMNASKLTPVCAWNDEEFGSVRPARFISQDRQLAIKSRGQTRPSQEDCDPTQQTGPEP